MLLVLKRNSLNFMFNDKSNDEISAKNRVRDFFTDICSKHPAIDITKLPSYLPADNNLPMYNGPNINLQSPQIPLGKASIR